MIFSFPTPYYAVIFTSVKTETLAGYEAMNDKIYDEVEKNEGYLGFENGTLDNDAGIHISYWDSMEAIEQWKNNHLHNIAKKQGIENWYKQYNIKICKVESDHVFQK